MQEPSDSASTTSSKPESKKRPKATLFLILLLLILLGTIGYLLWQLKLCQDSHAAQTAERQALQARIADLTKEQEQIAKDDSTSPASEEHASVCSTQREISTELKASIVAALTSKNNAALKGYMTDKVTVVLAASEKGGEVSADQAVTDLEYVSSNATPPWNFNLSEATLNSFKAGYYKQYFEGVTYVGESAEKVVVAFGFDMCGKINRIFISAGAELLL